METGTEQQRTEAADRPGDSPTDLADSFLARTRLIAVVAGACALSLSLSLAGSAGLLAALFGWLVTGVSFGLLVRGIQGAVESFTPNAPVRLRALVGLLVRQSLVALVLFVLIALLKASVLAIILGVSAWPLACLMAGGMHAARELRLAAPASMGRN